MHVILSVRKRLVQKEESNTFHRFQLQPVLFTTFGGALPFPASLELSSEASDANARSFCILFFLT